MEPKVIGKIAKTVGKVTATFMLKVMKNILDSKIVPSFVVLFAGVYWSVAIASYFDVIEHFEFDQ